MTKGTRSKVNLPEDIHEYLVESTNTTTMPGTETPPEEVTEAQDLILSLFVTKQPI